MCKLYWQASLGKQAYKVAGVVLMGRVAVVRVVQAQAVDGVVVRVVRVGLALGA